MDRRERRRRKRLEEKLRKKLGQQSPSLPKQAESPRKRSEARRFFLRTVSKTKLLKGFVLTGLSLLGSYALFRPHVSVEPDLLLNPGDPFSTQFSLTNQSRIFDTRDLQPACSTIHVITSHDVGLSGLPPRPSPLISRLGPQEKTTITCPPWLGGLGAGAGNVLVAYIEIDVSYKQDWWPLNQRERFPLKGVIDSRNGVHWTHITPEQLKADLSQQ
jgi:hypothetical protein